MTLAGGGSRARKRARRAEFVERVGSEDEARYLLRGRRVMGRSSGSVQGRYKKNPLLPAVTMYEVKEKAAACKSPFFDKDTMRFFKSKLVGGAVVGRDPRVTYFVTSEQGPHGPRAYSVRKQVGCQIKTVGDFQQYGTAAQAKAAIKKLVRK